ncbi:hypothetical protein ACC740_39195, partial [Rhizobium ruizarguesonis]
LDGVAHRARYERSARQSAAVWGYSVETGAADEGSDPVSFVVTTGEKATAPEAGAGSPGWQKKSRIHMVDHDTLVRR